MRIGDGSYSHDRASEFKDSAIAFVKDVFFPLYNGRLFHQRMFLVAVALTAIRYSLTDNRSLAEQHISCLKMYFAGIRDAYLSIFEVRSVLYACLKTTDKLHLFDSHSEGFHKLMPECPAKIEPRKLVHLARCEVRENLKKSNLPLPSAIDKLDLPKVLKSFLLGEIADVKRNEELHYSQTSPTLLELSLLDQSDL